MAHRKLRYSLVDVFTDCIFGGNPLAVFTNARGLTVTTMQAIANELNLSETTFVLPPDDASNDYRVRIFTPITELPMAGHPRACAGVGQVKTSANQRATAGWKPREVS